MFNQTRRKIVFAVIGSLLALMAVTLATISLSNRSALERENEAMLRTYVERYSLDGQPQKAGPEGPGFGPESGAATPEKQPGERNGRPDKNEPQFQLSTFYSVAYAADGSVLAVNNGNHALQSEEKLLELTASILSGGRDSGRIGNMTYLVEKRADYTLVAMIDGTIARNNQAILIRQMLIIGSAALAVLVSVAVFLARRIVRPLEDNDRRQKQFISDAGHELKTPIAVISANSELLRRTLGESEWLNNIDYENGRMSELVKQLLALSRAEGSPAPMESLDFSKLVGGEALPFESVAFERGKQIEWNLEPGLRVKGNPNQLKQLVSILLDNALSHGTGEAIRLALKREKHSAVLSVSNAADAMSAQQLAHLFDRFYRADEARGEAGAHYGLGLSIAKAVAEAHGGTIRAGYQDGRATFTVSIPTEKESASSGRGPTG